MAIVAGVSLFLVSVGFDIFPVPLGTYVAAGASTLGFPSMYLMFPSTCRSRAGFRRRFCIILCTLTAGFAIFGLACPLLNTWYIKQAASGQAVVVLIFLSLRILFEVLIVLLSKSVGGDIVPQAIFFTVTFFEWQVGILSTRACSWRSPLELMVLNMVLNILENLYFLRALPSRRADEDMSPKRMRVMVVLLVRELAEVLASCQYLVMLVCIYDKNPEENNTVRGMSAEEFTEGATIVGINAGLETLGLLCLLRAAHCSQRVVPHGRFFVVSSLFAVSTWSKLKFVVRFGC